MKGTQVTGHLLKLAQEGLFCRTEITVILGFSSWFRNHKFNRRSKMFCVEYRLGRYGPTFSFVINLYLQWRERQFLDEFPMIRKLPSATRAVRVRCISSSRTCLQRVTGGDLKPGGLWERKPTSKFYYVVIETVLHKDGQRRPRFHCFTNCGGQRQF